MSAELLASIGFSFLKIYVFLGSSNFLASLVAMYSPTNEVLFCFLSWCFVIQSFSFAPCLLNIYLVTWF